MFAETVVNAPVYQEMLPDDLCSFEFDVRQLPIEPVSGLYSQYDPRDIVNPAPGLALAYGGSHSRVAVFERVRGMSSPLLRDIEMGDRPHDTNSFLEHMAGQMVMRHAADDLRCTVAGLPFPVQFDGEDWLIGPAAKQGPFHDEQVRLLEGLRKVNPDCELLLDDPGRPFFAANDTLLMAHGVAGWYPDHPAKSIAALTLGTGMGGDVVYDDRGIWRARDNTQNEMGFIGLPWRMDDARKYGLKNQPAGIDDYGVEIGISPSVPAENVLSGSGIAHMFERPADSIGTNHRFWRLHGECLSKAIWNISMLSNLDIMVVGGGVAVNRAEIINERLAIEKRKVKGWAVGRLPEIELMDADDADRVELEGGYGYALDRMNRPEDIARRAVGRMVREAMGAALPKAKF